MKTFSAILLTILLFGLVNQSQAKKKIVCYWASWSFYRTGAGNYKISNINPNLCTHYIYTFTGLDIDSKISSLDQNLDLTNGGFKHFVNLKQKSTLNPKPKMILAIGGWNEGSLKYSVMAYNEESRKKFAESVLKFITYYNFDGIDLDWEYPTQRQGIANDRDNFSELLKTLKETLSPWNLTVSLAAPANKEDFERSYDYTEICKHADFISLMAYDLQSSDKTSNHADLSKVKLLIDSIDSTCHEKLILGVPSYGRSYSLDNPNENGPNAKVKGPGIAGDYTQEKGFLGYNEICEVKKKNNAEAKYFSSGEGAYITFGDQWISYDNQKTTLKKVEYVKNKKLGGMMLWTLDTDDFRNKCSEGTNPILNTIVNNLN